MKRYKHLLQLIDIFQPRTIVEIGTWNGHNAIRMLQRAAQYRENPYYIGYDLFEEATDETDAEEFNVKAHIPMETVQSEIKSACPASEVALVQGNTRETLSEEQGLIADFVFIDGGHSVETIEHDYNAVKGSSVIVFDDYYLPDADGAMPDISKVGCNLLVNGLPHAVIETNNRVEGGGLVGMAVVFGVQE